jgi:hypothetical protein
MRTCSHGRAPQPGPAAHRSHRLLDDRCASVTVALRSSLNSRCTLRFGHGTMRFGHGTVRYGLLASSGLLESCPRNGNVPKSP